MPTIYTFFALIISFLFVLIFLPLWVSRTKKYGFVGTDVQKLDKRKVAELGGLIVVLGAAFGILTYIATQVFIYRISASINLLAALSAILIALLIGMVDDILGWKIGLRKLEKVILSLLIALPIMAINAGISKMNIPFFGTVELGLIYPLLIVPIAVVGASNGFNMLAGANGLEAGMGIIILSSLSFIAWKTGASFAAAFAAFFVLALIAFLIFNWYPARIFPGDSLTYPVGAAIAITAIIGNIEKFALILFLPYFFEFFLKAGGAFKKESFGKVLKDGSLDLRYKRIYSLNHLAIWFLRKVKGKAYEWEITLLILFFEALIALFVLIPFLK